MIKKINLFFSHYKSKKFICVGTVTKHNGIKVDVVEDEPPIILITSEVSNSKHFFYEYDV